MRPGESRAARRDRERTSRVARSALHRAGGNREVAAARLRLQAGLALRAASVALERGAGDERVFQCIDMATRRLRAAVAVEGGEG